MYRLVNKHGIEVARSENPVMMRLLEERLGYGRGSVVQKRVWFFWWVECMGASRMRQARSMVEQALTADRTPLKITEIDLGGVHVAT